MSEYKNNLQVNDELPITTDFQVEQPCFNLAITPEVMAFYAERAVEMKLKIDQLGSETSQRQDKMRLINDIIAEINNLTDQKQCLNISTNQQLQEKLRAAKELGVHLIDGKVKFDSIERDRLIQNLHLAADSWDKENKNQTQKMEIYIKELDRVMMMLKEVQKSENQAKRGATAGIKGG